MYKILRLSLLIPQSEPLLLSTGQVRLLLSRIKDLVALVGFLVLLEQFKLMLQSKKELPQETMQNNKF
jgi:hypothetical protein